MSFSISAVSSSSAQFDSAPAPKPAAKPTEADQIKLLAEQGKSNADIASAVGLPETLVAAELGTTTTTTSSTSQASALLALGSRLSVHA
jgi:hypothetical protein